jgi:hypothetical protein
VAHVYAPPQARWISARPACYALEAPSLRPTGLERLVLPAFPPHHLPRLLCPHVQAAQRPYRCGVGPPSPRQGERGTRCRELEVMRYENTTPPSSDPLGHKRPRSQRWRTGKKPGGQSGHAGETLHLESTPDEIGEDELCGLSECGRPIDGVSWLTIEWSDDTEDRIGFCCDAHLWIAEEWAREMMEENARREAQEDK